MNQPKKYCQWWSIPFNLNRTKLIKMKYTPPNLCKLILRLQLDYWLWSELLKRKRLCYKSIGCAQKLETHCIGRTRTNDILKNEIVLSFYIELSLSAHNFWNNIFMWEPKTKAARQKTYSSIHIFLHFWNWST